MQDIISGEQVMNQNKFGYFMYNKETYLRLKKLRSYYFLAQKRAKAWFKWARKASHNRIGSEPSIIPYFSEKIDVKKQMIDYNVSSNKPQYSKDGSCYNYLMQRFYDKDYIPVESNHPQTILVKHNDILNEFLLAKRAYKNLDDVPREKYTLGHINKLISEIEV